MLFLNLLHDLFHKIEYYILDCKYIKICANRRQNFNTLKYTINYKNIILI